MGHTLHFGFLHQYRCKTTAATTTQITTNTAAPIMAGFKRVEFLVAARTVVASSGFIVVVDAG